MRVLFLIWILDSAHGQKTNPVNFAAAGPSTPWYLDAGHIAEVVAQCVVPYAAGRCDATCGEMLEPIVDTCFDFFLETTSEPNQLFMQVANFVSQCPRREEDCAQWVGGRWGEGVKEERVCVKWRTQTFRQCAEKMDEQIQSDSIPLVPKQLRMISMKYGKGWASACDPHTAHPDRQQVFEALRPPNTSGLLPHCNPVSPPKIPGTAPRHAKIPAKHCDHECSLDFLPLFDRCNALLQFFVALTATRPNANDPCADDSCKLQELQWRRTCKECQKMTGNGMLHGQDFSFFKGGSRSYSGAVLECQRQFCGGATESECRHDCIKNRTSVRWDPWVPDFTRFCVGSFPDPHPGPLNPPG